MSKKNPHLAAKLLLVQLYLLYVQFRINILKKIPVKLLIFTSLLIASTSFGQLGNYWTLQVGTEGTLLSGALIGAKNNNSGAFYNPASMASDSESSFSFNTSLFRIHFLNYKNLFGPNTKLKYNTGNFDPIFLSFLVPKKNKLNIKLGLSVMGKQSTDFRFQDRIYLGDFSFPLLPNQTGDYEGIYDYRLRSSEYWVNFSSSRKINEKWSMGLTLTAGIRTLDYEENQLSNYVSKDQNDQFFTATFQNLIKAYMYNVKLIAKVGAIYSLNENSRIGLNITSQSLNVFGNGSTKRIISQTNLNVLLLDSTNVIGDDKLISSYADGLKSNHKSPLSVAIGYNAEYENYKFGFAIEYFHKIDPYALIKGKDQNTLINSSGVEISEADFLTLYYGQRSIVNFAFGFERHINDVVTILTGFRTNFSTSINFPSSDVFLENYIYDVKIDYYHLTGGSTFTFLKNKFVFGLDLAFGFKQNEETIVNYSEPLVRNNLNVPLRGNKEFNTQILNFMLGIALGYSFQF